MLEVEDLSVFVKGSRVLRGIDLSIRKGEVHVLFGPNGSGKTTLFQAILGNPGFEVSEGRVLFKGRELNGLSMNERIEMGLGISHQVPPKIPGVRLRSLLEIISGREWGEVEEMVEELDLKDFLDREVNVGFSGGELKRSEILQIFAQDPDFVLFDEPDSGVDVENVELIGNVINRLMEKDVRPSKREKSGLVITHLGYILNFIEADRAHVLYDGSIICSGPPEEIFNEIVEHGYERCARCCRRTGNLV